MKIFKNPIDSLTISAVIVKVPNTYGMEKSAFLMQHSNMLEKDGTYMTRTSLTILELADAFVRGIPIEFIESRDTAQIANIIESYFDVIDYPKAWAKEEMSEDLRTLIALDRFSDAVTKKALLQGVLKKDNRSKDTMRARRARRELTSGDVCTENQSVPEATRGTMSKTMPKSVPVRVAPEKYDYRPRRLRDRN